MTHNNPRNPYGRSGKPKTVKKPSTKKGRSRDPSTRRKGTFRKQEAQFLRENGITLTQKNQLNMAFHYQDELTDLINGADPNSLGLNPGELTCLKRNNLLTLHNKITNEPERLLVEIGCLEA